MAAHDKGSGIEKMRQTAPANAAGKRFDAIVALLFGDYSRSRLQDWIKRGLITANGQQRKPSDKLIGGEAIELLVPEDALADGLLDEWDSGVPKVPAQPIPVERIYSDDHIFIVNKPAALVMHPAPGNRTGTLMNGLLSIDEALRMVPRAGIVHRLDKDTSGLCVVARTLQSHTALVSQLQSRSMSREYLAIVLGELPNTGTIEEPIGRHPKDRKRMAVNHAGKYACTHYEVVERFEGCSLLAVKLDTGRTHQIRVHLTHLGHPLLGDPVYGRRSTSRPLWVQKDPLISQFERQALHAFKLGLVHPDTGEAVQFEQAPPDDFAQLLQTLRDCYSV